jgi:hypothetical protein
MVAVSIVAVSSAVVIASVIVSPESAVIAAESAVVTAEASVTCPVAPVEAIAINSAEPSVVTIEPVEVTIATKPVIAFKAMEPSVVVPVMVVKPMEAPRKISISRPIPALIEHWVHVVKPIPRAGANEHAVDKPLRPPVTIRSATKRIVRIVSVRTCRGNVVVAVIRTDMNTDRNLGRRRHCRHRDEYTEQR